MTAISETSVIETLKKRKRSCADLQQIARKATGVHSGVVLLTSYATQPEYTQEVAHCDDPSGVLDAIDAIDNAPGTKIVSDFYRGKNNLILSTPQKNTLSSYFTETNKKDSKVVRHEEALLKACGYKTDEGYYFAIPVPPGKENPRGIFFLFARDEQEAVAIEEKIVALLEAISEYFNLLEKTRVKT